MSVGFTNYQSSSFDPDIWQKKPDNLKTCEICEDEFGEDELDERLHCPDCRKVECDECRDSFERDEMNFLEDEDGSVQLCDECHELAKEVCEAHKHCVSWEVYCYGVRPY